MILDFETINRIKKGCCRTIENDGWFSFYRFSEAERETYRSNDVFYGRTMAGSSICLDFNTDSESFSFEYTVKKAGPRNFYCFDICVNGIIASNAGEEEFDKGYGTVSIKLGCGRKRITLYLTCCAYARLKNITVDDGAEINSAASGKKIISYGDSITQGYDAKYPSLNYISRLMQEFDAECINKAIGGDVMHCENILRSDFKPYFVTVAYGTNDWSKKRDFEEFSNETHEYLKKMSETYKDTKIFVITPIWRADCECDTNVGKFEDACDKIKHCCMEFKNITVIDGLTLVPHMKEFFRDEKIHPNDLGFMIYAGNLIREIKKHI